MIQTVALWAVLMVQAVPGTLATATIQGVVVADDTGAPLAGAHVTYYQKQPPNPNAPINIKTRTSGDGHEPAAAGSLAITDDGGRFVLKNLQAGSYSFFADRNGYESAYVEYTPVGEGQTLRDLVIRMTPIAAGTGKVSGHILDSSGRPVPLVRVLLIRRKFDSRGNPSFDEDATAQTNDLGEYRMYGVEPGRYYVVCDGDIRNRNNNPNASRSNYALSFYPGVSDFSKASTIEVRRGAETDRVDFQTHRTGLYRIHGRIIDSRAGQPPAQVTVRVTNPGLSGSHNIGMNYNPADGSIESAPLPPGIYRLEAQTSANSDETADAVVVLGNSDVDGLLLTLAPASSGYSISGRISVEGTLPKNATLTSIGISFELLPRGEVEVLNYENSAFDTAMNEDGTFMLTGIPEGEYRLNLKTPPPGFYVRTALLDGDDVLAQARSFTHGATLEVVLSRGGQVDGVIRTEGLRPGPSLYVVLIPDDRTRKDLFTSIKSDASGRFTFQGIAPGDYKVFSWDHLEDNDYFDPDFLRDFESLGRSVHVTDASTRSIEIRVITAQATP